MTKEKYENKTFSTKAYGTCTVVEYVNSNNVIVKFDKTGYVVKTSIANLQKGLVKDLLHPCVGGVGYLGVGKYVCRNKTPDGMRTKEYSCWESMMKRAYGKNSNHSARAYEDVEVCKEWHNYQVFAEWCQTQIGFGVKGFNLDKDILMQGNRVYCPEYCRFVPQHVNTAVTGMKHFNTTGYPGVVENGAGNYTSEITLNSVGIHLGTFPTKEKAFLMYKNIKEAYIRSLAEIYREDISSDVYEALKKWGVNENNLNH